MIPYWHPAPIHLGPLTIEFFGVFAALGVFLGAQVCSRRARAAGLDPVPLVDFAFWGVIAGVVSGHLVHLFFYHPEELQRGPLQILKVWDGLSSFGGLLGGVVAAMVFFRVKGYSFRRYSDALAQGVASGWAVARVGCYAVNDHPGVLTSFPLAVNYPGGPRHDLGLYDAFVLGALALLLYTLARKGLLKERLLPLLALLYGTSRFFLDFLRASDLGYVDARYLGLTPAQYGCFLLVGYGLYQLARGARAQQAPAAAQAATPRRKAG